MGIISRKILAAGSALLLLCGVAACGGGGGTPTPTEPTAIYGGAATAGDIFVIKMDYPSTGKATIIRSETDGTLIGSRELSYTASGTKYTFTDSDSNTFTGLIVPDSFFAMQLPDATDPDIIVAVIVDTTIDTVAELSFVKDESYILTQFRHDIKGVKWVWSNVALNGDITGHHAVGDINDTTTDNTFAAGMNVDNLIYNAATLGFTMTVVDDGETQTWTYYVTRSGLGVIDKGSLKGIRFNTLKGSSTDPASYGITAGSVYNGIFYGSRAEGDDGTMTGTITVTAVTADSFTVTIAPEGEAPMTMTFKAPASNLWYGFFLDEAGTNVTVQPVGTSAFVFAGVQGDWNYNYGVGVK